MPYRFCDGAAAWQALSVAQLAGARSAVIPSAMI